jgi:hypothetical protein
LTKYDMQLLPFLPAPTSRENSLGNNNHEFAAHILPRQGSVGSCSLTLVR